MQVGAGGHLWLSALGPVPAGFSSRVKMSRRLFAREEPVLMSWLAAHSPFLRWSGCPLPLTPPYPQSPPLQGQELVLKISSNTHGRRLQDQEKPEMISWLAEHSESLRQAFLPPAASTLS